MKTFRSSGRTGAFTLLELLLVIAIIAILAALLLPVVNKAQLQAKRAQCVSQLRQAGIAFQAFAHDHNNSFPMAVPSSAGGTLELAISASRLQPDFYFSAGHWQALSNDLVTPRILACPTDTRLPALSFGALNNDHISYFVGVNADYTRPNSILAGDRNVTNDYAGAGSVVRLGPSYALRWTHELHQFKGNLLFSDGHVEEKNSAALVAAVNQSPAVAVLALPASQPTGPAVRNSSGAPVMSPPALATEGPGTPANQSVGRAQTAKTTTESNNLGTLAMASTRRTFPAVSSTTPEPTTPLRDSKLTNLNTYPQAAASVSNAPGLSDHSNPSLVASAIQAPTRHQAHKAAWLLCALLVLVAAAVFALSKLARTKKVPAPRHEDPEA